MEYLLLYQPQCKKSVIPMRWRSIIPRYYAEEERKKKQYYPFQL